MPRKSAKERREDERTHIEWNSKILGIDHTFIFSITRKENQTTGKREIISYKYRPTDFERLKFARLGVKIPNSIKRKYYPDIIEEIERLCGNSSQEILNTDFESAFLDFLEYKKSNKNRRSTYANVIFTAEHYIIPYFKDMLVCEIEDTDCTNMLTALLNKGYSKSIIDKAYIYTKEFFTYLKNKGVITISPMDLVERISQERINEKREALKRSSDRLKYLEDDDIARLREAAHNGYESEYKNKKGKLVTQHRTFEQPLSIDLLLTTGLRLGEFCALKWTDWDREKHSLKISRSRSTHTMDGKTVTEDTAPKNAASKSELKLLNQASEILEQMRAEDPPEYNGYIIHNKNFEPISPHAYSDRFSRIAIAAGLYTIKTDKDGKEYKKPTVSPHVLRHTYASILWAHTTDVKMVQTKLRHADPETTLKTYTDIMKEKEEELNENLKI